MATIIFCLKLLACWMNTIALPEKGHYVRGRRGGTNYPGMK